MEDDTKVDEIADQIYRLSTYTDAVPGGFTFNQFLVVGDDCLIFHTGLGHLFPAVSGAAASVVPLDRVRWISFGHWEADESGALNRWLDAAPSAQLVTGGLGVLISGGDQAERPPRDPLADGELLELGDKRLRWIDTPHVPHGWDAGLWFEETTRTLLCGDLFTQVGPAQAVTDADIVAPAAAAEDLFHATCLTPQTGPTLRRLADLAPQTLALMHGPAFTGDGTGALHALAEEYDARLKQALGT